MAGQGASKRRRRLPTRFRDGSALANADGRARDVRAVRDGVRAILQDQGGEAEASFLLRRVALRTSFLDVILSRDELALAEGKEIDRPGYIKAAQVWLKYATQIGTVRRAKPVESLRDYTQRIAAEDQSGGRSVA